MEESVGEQQPDFSNSAFIHLWKLHCSEITGSLPLLPLLVSVAEMPLTGTSKSLTSSFGQMPAATIMRRTSKGVCFINGS